MQMDRHILIVYMVLQIETALTSGSRFRIDEEYKKYINQHRLLQNNAVSHDPCGVKIHKHYTFNQVNLPRLWFFYG